jgi:hypothetical protein
MHAAGEVKCAAMHVKHLCTQSQHLYLCMHYIYIHMYTHIYIHTYTHKHVTGETKRAVKTNSLKSAPEWRTCAMSHLTDSERTTCTGELFYFCLCLWLYIYIYIYIHTYIYIYIYIYNCASVCACNLLNGSCLNEPWHVRRAALVMYMHAHVRARMDTYAHVEQCGSDTYIHIHTYA